MGKGSTHRKAQIDEDQMKSNWDRIFGKKEEEPQYEEEFFCPACGGPTYTKPHWNYIQCDDCLHRVKKQEMEP